MRDKDLVDLTTRREELTDCIETLEAIMADLESEAASGGPRTYRTRRKTPPRPQVRRRGRRGTARTRTKPLRRD